MPPCPSHWTGPGAHPATRRFLILPPGTPSAQAPAGSSHGLPGLTSCVDGGKAPGTPTGAAKQRSSKP